MSDYWKHCLESILEEHNVQVSPEQLDGIAEDLKHSHEMYGEYSGEYNILNPIAEELERTKRALKDEKDKVICKVCGGRGSITESFGPVGRSSTGTCSNCNGHGKVKA